MEEGNATEVSSEWSFFKREDGNLPYDMLGGPKFIKAFPATAWAYMIICGSATIIGLGGNCLVLLSFTISKELQRGRNVFIFNVAIADTVVTGFADPFSIVGIVNGKAYFDARPNLCSALAVICLAACITVLLSIGGVSFNRYINIVHPPLYFKVFGLKKNIAMCASFWLAGFLVASSSLWGWTHNVYDPKHLECIWNRTGSLSFTIFFSVGLIFIPVCVIAFSYIQIFRHVRTSRRRVEAVIKDSHDRNVSLKSMDKSVKVAKSLFMIFAVFALCWTPYAIIVLIDFRDRAPLEAHMFVLLLAHFHSTANSIIYYFTNNHFKESYKRILSALTCSYLKFTPRDSCEAERTEGSNLHKHMLHVQAKPSSQSVKPT